MKRISSLIIAVILLVSTLVPVTAVSEFTQENITIEQNLFDIVVTVTTDTDGRMLARLSDDAKTILYGIDFSDTPVEEDGVYTYTFTFGLEGSVPTSTLRVCVSNNVPSTEKTHNYVSLNDLNNFYNGLDAITDPDEISGYFVANSTFVPVVLTEYNALSPDIREMVDVIIEDLPLATGYVNSETETPEYSQQKAAKIQEVEGEFKTAFTEAMKYAKIVDTEEANWETVVNDEITSGLFDGKYYTRVGETPAILEESDVFAAFATEVTAMEGLSEAEVKKAFDRATLLAIKNKCAPGILKNAFVYFVKGENKGTITVSDMTDIDALLSSGNAEFWSRLKEAECADCATLVNKAIEIADAITTGNTLPEGGNAPSGENNSSVTSPGGFTGGSLGGGGTSKPATPTTPVDPQPVTPAGAFSDIASVDWAKESIEALAEMGVLNGKGAGIFAPNDSVTREEFIKIIVAAFELSDDEAACDFNDVAKDSWSYPYIAAAAKLGIVSGDGDNFNPTSGISRQDMAVIIYRVFEHLGLDVSGDSITFDDNAEIADYAKDAVEVLTAAGIINGMGDGTFAPAGTVTRAQAAKVIYGLVQIIGGGK